MPTVKVKAKPRKVETVLGFTELSRWDRQWIIGRGDRRFLSHRMECNMTIEEWLRSGPGKALTARYPFLAPELWCVINENRTDESDEAEAVLEDALAAEAGMPNPPRLTEAEWNAERDAFWKGVFGGGPS
jgi:hypothetical protein